MSDKRTGFAGLCVFARRRLSNTRDDLSLISSTSARRTPTSRSDDDLDEITDGPKKRSNYENRNRPIPIPAQGQLLASYTAQFVEDNN
ncbi:hypothetical protein Q1695_006750 [Nippostrongylus brasiliensis]|nr:hypothetical protein Q1695_006750 [Nippostrongylus brasiliensis]